MIHPTVSRRVALTRAIVAGVAISACGNFDVARGRSTRGGDVRQQAAPANAASRADSLARELARLQSVSAEKDSALAQVRETQDVIDAISRELSSIPGVDSRRIVVGGNHHHRQDLHGRQSLVGPDSHAQSAGAAGHSPAPRRPP